MDRAWDGQTGADMSRILHGRTERPVRTLLLCPVFSFPAVTHDCDWPAHQAESSRNARENLTLAFSALSSNASNVSSMPLSSYLDTFPPRISLAIVQSQ